MGKIITVKEKKTRGVTDEEQERVNFILKRAQQMWNAKNEYSKHWKDYERIWKFFEEERSGEDKWRANLPDTWSYATIKTAQSVFVDSHVAPLFKKKKGFDSAKSRDLSDLYQDIAEKGGLDKELYYARLDTFKLGNGFLKTVYVEDKREVYKINRFDPESGTFEYELDEIKDFDDPKTVRVSPYFMLVDEMARADFQTARDAIELEVMHIDDAKRLYGHLISDWDQRIKPYGILKSMMLSEVQGTSLAQTADTNTGQNKFKGFRFFAPIEFSDDMVEILHYWNWTHDLYEFIISGSPVRVRTSRRPSPIPYIHKQLPYTAFQYSPYSGDEFWAAGIIEVGKAEVNAIRKHREMMSDRQKLSLFSPAFSDFNSEIDQKVLKLKPFSIIRTRGSAPRQYQIPGISNADIQVKSDHEESYKRAVGIDERVLGFSSDKIRLTATEINFLREASLRRLREFVGNYSNALIREVRLKIKLFEQYYASPFKVGKRLKDGKFERYETMAKRFKIKLGNVYIEKEVKSDFFDGNIELDLDMQLLLPMTQAQVLAQWGQILRDVTPFVQAGMIKLDMEKVIIKYISALNVDIDTLRPDEEAEAIKLAQGEHELLINPNTSRKFTEDVLPDGTPEEFLNAAHLKKHKELLDIEQNVGEVELRNLVAHIAKDVDNFRKIMNQERQQAQLQLQPQALAGVGGVLPPQATLPSGQGGGSALFSAPAAASL